MGWENGLEELLQWEWCIFYGCREVVTLAVAYLGPRMWAEPAVEWEDDCRWKFNGSPMAHIPSPPPTELHVRKVEPLSHLCTWPREGSSDSSAAPRSGRPSGAKQPRGKNWGSTYNVLRCPPTHTHTYLYKCIVPDNLTPHPLQFLLCCFNLSQLSRFSRFYFLFSSTLSLPLHSVGSQLGLNTHRWVFRTNINSSDLEDCIGSLLECVIWGARDHMLKILFKALVLNLVNALLRLSLSVMIYTSLSTS